MILMTGTGFYYEAVAFNAWQVEIMRALKSRYRSILSLPSRFLVRLFSWITQLVKGMNRMTASGSDNGFDD